MAVYTGHFNESRDQVSFKTRTMRAISCTTLRGSIQREEQRPKATLAIAVSDRIGVSSRGPRRVASFKHAAVPCARPAIRKSNSKQIGRAYLI